MYRGLWVVVMGLLLAACASHLGSKRNPVKCEGMEGQVAYLERLRDTDGNPVLYKHLGVIPGHRAGNIYFDVYEIWNADSTRTSIIYMNMYNMDYVENRPVRGFQLVVD